VEKENGIGRREGREEVGRREKKDGREGGREGRRTHLHGAERVERDGLVLKSFRPIKG